MEKNILIVDDEPSIIKVLDLFLKKEGFNIDSASSISETYKKLKKKEYSMIFLDINLPDGKSLDYFDKIKSISNNSSIVVMTAQDNMDNAINSMKLGAYDYLDKPINLDSDLLLLVERAMNNYLKNLQIRNLENDLDNIKKDNFEVIGKSSSIQKIFKDIGKISNSDHTVLIRGESGTGKEMIGRAIHANSLNNKGPYIQVNVTAIPADLLESELFGYEKGAFTGAEKKKSGRFEEADNGTILLDEIGDMSIDLQSKLLRVIEEKKFYKLGSQKPTSFNCRIIASTNKNLEELINEKKFRDDLFYRLNTISIDIPPLRDRKEDVPHLITYFLEKYPDHNSGIKTVDNEIIEIFMKYDWPGNVRELENTIKKLTIMSNNSHLTSDDIEEHFPKIFKSSSNNFANLNYNLLIDTILNKDESDENKYQNILKKVKTTIIESTLIKYKGNKEKTTDELGINNKDFDKLLKDLKISKNLFKSD
mgnify:FL=1